MAEPGVFASADDVLDPGVNPVGSVDVGALAAPAPCARGQVRRPQGVPPSVLGLEQGELRAGMRALAAGEDPYFSSATLSAGRRPGPRAGARSAR